jgi:hypothetical protein
MRARQLLLCLVILAGFGLGGMCDDLGTIQITSPTGDVATSSFVIAFELEGNFSPPQAFLNFQPLVVTQTGAFTYTASPGGTPTVNPGPPLQDENLIVVKALRNDGVMVTAGQPFDYNAPKARAYEIDAAGDCPVSGPLAHRRLGDYCLENALARYVVQDVTAPAVPTDPTPRDLQSVGQYGGNIIDAVQPSNPTTDNFIEFQAMMNIETVANYQTLTVVNDGQDGTAAIIRVCGPDDLLDFVNPSSMAPLPAGTDDTDYNIQACTSYRLEPATAHVRIDTQVFNNTGAQLRQGVGDWGNVAGEVDGFFKPNPGVGEALTQRATGGLSWFAERRLTGADRFEYAYALQPGNVTGYITISGVMVITHNVLPAALLLGAPLPFIIPAGGSNTYTRYFSVGDGSGNAAQELSTSLAGTGTGTIQGCVTMGGAPAENAKVSVYSLTSGALTNALAHFITGANGCYSGRVEIAPNATTNYGIIAGRERTLYVGGAATPPITQRILFPANDVEVVNFALPATGQINVSVTDEGGLPLPARVTVVGIDPSAELTVAGTALPGFGGATLGRLNDVNDDENFGVVAFEYTGADGMVSFEVEPGSYHVFASRGTEYSAWSTNLPSGPGLLNVVAGAPVNLAAQIARVVDTPGFVSSDFHVHGIASPDSQVPDVQRAEGYAGEGVDNIVATDHHVHHDYKPTIAALGLSSFVTATIGEEITTFDYGHFNSYPVTIDASVPSGGSTDWAVAEPPGQDFPGPPYFAYNMTPADIFDLATTNAQATPSTTVQINHIDSHFSPLQINTAVAPIVDGMDAAERATRRLDPASGNLFFPFPALELWNGNTRGHQTEFLGQRIGIWMNLLDQDIPTTAIADTDTHEFLNTRHAGARTWTAASAGMDTPATLDPAEIGAAVYDGRAVGGQGIYVQARLLATDGSGAVADFTTTGATTVASANGAVDFEVTVKSPAWAQWDVIQIYTNAGGNVSSVVVNPATPYLYTAAPLITLDEGDCNPATTGGDFEIDVVDVYPAIDGADRWETTVTVPFAGLTANTWFVAVVKGTDGQCGPMFPVYPADLAAASNPNAAAMVDGNVGESGTMALGHTNALYYLD